MLHSLKLNNKDFKFGITRVFFRPGKFIEFDRLLRSDPENLKAIVANVKKWLIRSRWIKSAFCAICVIKSKVLRYEIAKQMLTKLLFHSQKSHHLS
jgi:myosin VI